jgi:enamine deaminase RidA (YjgF/YER057c/UK114 family)
MSVESRLHALGLRLPEAPRSLAQYVPAVQIGSILITSGVLPMRDGRLDRTGKLGSDFTVEEGRKAAQIAVLNGLAIIKQELGDLDRVERVVKLTGYIASAPGFTQQPAVLDGASTLLVEVFGEAGRHARAAVGAAELPLGAPVEIELTVQVRS